ncbi:MAG: geranylgeranyl reductase family protein [Elusimicrobiota bacterium]
MRPEPERRAPDYDAIIVGGGPAGATAALGLVGGGLSILLLDKAVFPRDKPCGGGISMRLTERFPHVREGLESIPVHHVHKVHLQAPDGSSLMEERPDPLYLMIRRREFDAMLLRLATERGLEVLEGARVTRLKVAPGHAEVRTDRGDVLRAKLVIGADGVNSVVAKDAGLNPGWPQDSIAVDMMEETPYASLQVRDKDAMYVFYGVGHMHGYGYVFPKADHLNLGLGILISDYKARANGTPYAGHLRFLDGLAKSGIVRGSSERGNFRGYRIPVGGALERTYADRVLLCGDAAGFVNAFTGEGIYFAMASGEHAARAALGALERGRFDAGALAGYQRLWRDEFGRELEQSVTVQRILFEDPGRINLIVRSARENAALRALLTDYATGRVDFRAAKRRLMAHFLPFYVRHKLGKWATRLRAAVR